MKGWGGRLTVILSLCALPRAAGAQAASGETQVQASAAYERGMASLNGQRYADAIVEFRESYRLNPLPDVLFNLALAFRGSGRIAAALGAFERYLATAPADAPTPRVQAIRLLLPQLQQSERWLLLALARLCPR